MELNLAVQLNQKLQMKSKIKNLQIILLQRIKLKSARDCRLINKKSQKKRAQNNQKTNRCSNLQKAHQRAQSLKLIRLLRTKSLKRKVDNTKMMIISQKKSRELQWWKAFLLPRKSSRKRKLRLAKLEYRKRPAWTSTFKLSLNPLALISVRLQTIMALSSTPSAD